jgi:hypothetical protein
MRSWTTEEEEILVEWVKNHGSQSWRGITKLFSGRSFRECREHWRFYHARVDRRPWSPEEDSKVVECYGLWGNKWKKIAQLLPDRTENAVKNRWHSVLRERMVSEPYRPHHVNVHPHKETSMPVAIVVPVLMPGREAMAPMGETTGRMLFASAFRPQGTSEGNDTTGLESHK